MTEMNHRDNIANQLIKIECLIHTLELRSETPFPLAFKDEWESYQLSLKTRKGTRVLLKRLEYLSKMQGIVTYPIEDVIKRTGVII